MRNMNNQTIYIYIYIYIYLFIYERDFESIKYNETYVICQNIIWYDRKSCTIMLHVYTYFIII